MHIVNFAQRYMRPSVCTKDMRLKHDFAAVNLEHKDVTDGAYLTAGEQLHAARTFVLIELETDAVIEFENTAGLIENDQVHGVRLHQHVRHGTHVNRL